MDVQETTDSTSFLRGRNGSGGKKGKRRRGAGEADEEEQQQEEDGEGEEYDNGWERVDEGLGGGGEEIRPRIQGRTKEKKLATVYCSGKQIPSFLWPIIMAIYSSVLGYCMVVQINQEATIQRLHERLAELQKFVNYTVLRESETIRDELIRETEELMEQKIFESFKYLNGSRCLAIAQNCAVDLIKYVPTSILYSGISKCGQLVGLS